MTLFHSKQVHGVVMNRYGVVMRGNSTLATTELRDFVWREARAAGWTLKQGDDRDAGLVWTPPDAPDAGKGQE
jgi:hypothetical protein